MGDWHQKPPPGITPFMISTGSGRTFTIPGVVPELCENCGKVVALLHCAARGVIEDDDLYEVSARDNTEVWTSHTAKRCRAWRRWKEQQDA